MARPRFALAKWFEGADVDERGLGAQPLHVVGRGVPEDHALLEGVGEQLQQSRVARHPERPLIGVGDDGDRLVAQQAGPVRAELRGPVGRGDELRAHDSPVLLDRPQNDVASPARKSASPCALSAR
jgi:hypothetical protein